MQTITHHPPHSPANRSTTAHLVVIQNNGILIERKEFKTKAEAEIFIETYGQPPVTTSEHYRHMVSRCSRIK